MILEKAIENPTIKIEENGRPLFGLFLFKEVGKEPRRGGYGITKDSYSPGLGITKYNGAEQQLICKLTTKETAAFADVLGRIKAGESYLIETFEANIQIEANEMDCDIYVAYKGGVSRITLPNDLSAEFGVDITTRITSKELTKTFPKWQQN